MKAVDPANKRYVVRLDDRNDISILLREGKTWIKALRDGSTAPVAPACNFNEPAGRVSKNAPASAELFKRVIYDWKNEVKRGNRLDITFEMFEVGKTFKNIVTARGRIEDFIPTNAIIYPIKSRYTTCEEFTTTTTRVVTEVNFSCYVSASGDWVCKNGAPREIERISIPKD